MRRSIDHTKAEKAACDALRAHLSRDEILMTGVRITDPRDGDVEIDALVLFPDLGAAVLEIKGGLVEYRSGEWTTSRGSYRRRIHPTEQARKAKHALRRYLDRQPEWTGPLLRTEWFVVVPQTPVTADMGPEGERSHLIGEHDLATMRERIRHVLGSTLNADPVPHSGWEHDVLSLLLRTSGTRAPKRGRRSRVVAAVAATVLALGGLMWWMGGQTAPDSPSTPVPVTGECHPDYEPCLPLTDDLDCSAIGRSVTVTGKDPYDLDRDGDGQACESFG